MGTSKRRRPRIVQEDPEEKEPQIAKVKPVKKKKPNGSTDSTTKRKRRISKTS